MTLQEQLERLLRITMLVFVLAAASFLSALTAIRIAIRGRIVAMPNLVGKPVSDAQKHAGRERPADQRGRPHVQHVPCRRTRWCGRARRPGNR